VIRLEFRGDGEFEANNAAEAWCRKMGISVGAMQGGEPRGLVWGNALIAKWRNLDQKDRDALDGRMEFPAGRPRRSPVVVAIADPRDPVEVDPAAPHNVERREVLRQARIALAEEFHIPLSAPRVPK
jgi:hypothetical protein